MTSKRVLKTMFIGLAIASVFFSAGFLWVQYQTSKSVPWRIVFLTDRSGVPSVLIEHETLGISQKISFPEEKLRQVNVVRARYFDVPLRVLPFGKLVLLDAPSLPGRALFEFFGHRIELNPRKLVVNGVEHPWKQGSETCLGRIHRGIPTQTGTEARPAH